MSQNEFSSVGETPRNYEKKLLCVLVLDISGSMQGKPLQELQAGLAALKNDTQADATARARVEIAVVTFESSVQVPSPACMIDEWQPPVLQAGGTTKMVDGVRRGLEVVSERKAYYDSTGQDYARPYLLLITDGAPDSDQDVNGLSGELRSAVEQKRLQFFAFYTDGGDRALLEKLCPAPTKPALIVGHSFVEFFKWLSKSLQKASAAKKGDQVAVQLPSTLVFEG